MANYSRALGNKALLSLLVPSCHTGSSYFVTLVLNVPGKFLTHCDSGTVFVTYAPGMWEVDLVCTLIIISRVWVDSSRSRIHVPYPSGTSEPAWGFPAVRLVFESRTPLEGRVFLLLTGHCSASFSAIFFDVHVWATLWECKSIHIIAHHHNCVCTSLIQSNVEADCSSLVGWF